MNRLKKLARFMLTAMASTVWIASAAADAVFDFRPLASNSQNGAVPVLLSTTPQDVGSLRAHRVKTNVQETIQEVAVGDTLTFRLFDDKAFRVRLVERLPTRTESQSWMGIAEGYGETINSVVVRTEAGWQLDVQDFQNSRSYHVFSANGEASVYESDPSARKTACGTDTLSVDEFAGRMEKKAVRDALAAEERTSAVENSGSTYVDMLLVFDKAAQAWCDKKGTTMEAFASTAVAKMNTALANTGLDSYFRYRLAGVLGINGDGGTSLRDVLHACSDQTVYNGVDWSPVVAKRNEIGADVVSILIDIGESYSGTVTTGIGYSPPNDVWDWWDWTETTFNCCAISYVADDHTMTHEVGHNLGCGHADEKFVNPKYISPGPGLFDHSSGYHFTANGTAYHTIMAYNFDGWGNSYVCCPYFSSPDYQYYGVAVGDSTHDNTATLRTTFAKVAAIRNPSGSVATEAKDSFTAHQSTSS